MKVIDKKSIKDKRKNAFIIDTKPKTETTTTQIGVLSPTSGIVEQLSVLESFSLLKKAQKSGISIDDIMEVYSRGLYSWLAEDTKTPQQLAFARVNSYIAGGKAYLDDADLRG